MVQQEYNQILTAGEDGYLKVFDLEAHKAKRMHSISSIALTSMTLLNQPNIVAVIYKFIFYKLNFKFTFLHRDVNF